MDETKALSLEWDAKTLKIGGVDITRACRAVSIDANGDRFAIARLELFVDLGKVTVKVL